MKLNSTLRLAVFALGALIATAAAVAWSGGNDAVKADAHHAISSKSPSAIFHDNMRVLWEDHIAWTRLAIISIGAGLPDAQSTTARLLQNQVDIGTAIKPYYGGSAGDQLTALLKDHIVIAADLVTAAGAGDSAAVEEASTRWYANADDIGSFLAAANPQHWQDAEMKSMMREHLDLTLQEAVHYLTGDFNASVADYDRIHQQILQMADMLSDGIVAQFPASFTANSGR